MANVHAQLLAPRFEVLLDDRERAAHTLAGRFAKERPVVAAGTAAAAGSVSPSQRTELAAGGVRSDRDTSCEVIHGATWRDGPAASLPIVAVADLHGHLATFERMLAYWDQTLGADYRLVLLGDYVDNGPDTPGLLQRMVALEQERGDRCIAILGNHDLACLRSMGWDGGPPDEAWFAHWLRRYWNPGGSTAAAYGATSGATLAAKMPAPHRAFLQARPWCAEVDEYVFVHAGFAVGPLEPQIRALAARPLLAEQRTVDPLRNKALACTEDPAWTRTVVSAHTKYPLDRAASGARRAKTATCWPHFVGARRITLSASVDEDGVLWSVLLPERRFVSVDRHGNVTQLNEKY